MLVWLRELEEVEIDGGTIVGVPFMGEHSDLDIRTKMATPDSDPMVASNRLIEDCRSRGIGAERLFGEKEIAVFRSAPAEPVLALQSE